MDNFKELTKGQIEFFTQKTQELHRYCDALIGDMIDFGIAEEMQTKLATASICATLSFSLSDFIAWISSQGQADFGDLLGHAFKCISESTNQMHIEYLKTTGSQTVFKFDA